MSNEQSNLSRNQKELACCAFIRINSNHSVPIGITKLCLNYFDEIFYITIRGNKLKQFLNTNNGKCIIKQFKYNNDISFEIHIFPNGETKNEKGYVMLYIKALYDENKISNLLFNFNNICSQTNSQFECNGYAETPRDRIGWSGGTMQLNDCKNINELIFNIYIDLIWIEYKLQKNWIKSFTLNKHMKINFEIEKNKFQNWKFGQNIKRKCDNALIVQFYPYGEIKGDNGKAVFAVHILKWPFGIKTIACNWKSTVNKIEFEGNGMRLIDPDDCLWAVFELIETQLSNTLQFTMDIELIQLYDRKDNIIKIPTDGIIYSDIILQKQSD